MFSETLSCKLRLSRREYRVGELLRSELSRQCIPRRREQHLLPHVRRVGDIGNANKGHSIGVVTSQYDVRWLVLCQEGLELCNILLKGAARRDGFAGDECFFVDADQEPAYTQVRDEAPEGGEQFLGGCIGFEPQLALPNGRVEGNPPWEG